MSAATWLGRYRRRVAVVDAGERRNRWVDQSHGYLGLDPVDPARLVDRGVEALCRYETAEFLTGRVRDVVHRPNGMFALEVEGADGVDRGRPLTARRLVLATGVEDRFPDVEGFFEHYGRDVFHCPTCDGYEACGRRVVAFGWSEHVAAFALSLLDWAASVTVVTDGSDFEGDAACRAALDRHGVTLLEDDAVSLLGLRGHLEGVRLRGGATVPCELAFFSIAHRPRNELAVLLGCALTPEGCVVVGPEGETTVPGVYAAGDVTHYPGKLELIATGYGEAAIAVNNAVHYLNPKARVNPGHSTNLKIFAQEETGEG